MAKRIIRPPILTELSGAHQSALIEIRRQLNQAYALVNAARTVLLSQNQGDTTPCDLLDMAEDLLGDHEWINRMDELQPREEVAHAHS